MTLQISWQKAPIYPALIKGPAVGIIDGHLLVAGGQNWVVSPDGNETRDSVRGNTYGTVFAGRIRTD